MSNTTYEHLKRYNGEKQVFRLRVIPVFLEGWKFAGAGFVPGSHEGQAVAGAVESSGKIPFENVL